MTSCPVPPGVGVGEGVGVAAGGAGVPPPTGGVEPPPPPPPPPHAVSNAARVMIDAPKSGAMRRFFMYVSTHRIHAQENGEKTTCSREIEGSQASPFVWYH